MKATLAGLATATLLIGAAPLAQAAQDDSSLGFSLGYVEARRVESTLVFSGDYRFHLGGILALAPEFSYWKRAESSVAVSSSIQDLQFGVNLLAVLPAGRRVELFAGGGGGLHHLTGNLGVGTSTAISNSVTQGGVALLGGMDISTGDTLSFFVSARYDWVLGLGGEEPTRLDQLKIQGGFRVRF